MNRIPNTPEIPEIPGFHVLSIVIAEDDIIRGALQEIWEMENLEPRVRKVVDQAVSDIDALTELRKRNGERI